MPAQPEAARSGTRPIDAHRVALFMFRNRDGGVERTLVNLALGCAAQGIETDLIVSNVQGPFLDDLPDAVRLFEVPESSSHAAAACLRAYLRMRRPQVILTGKPSDDRMVLTARNAARVTTRCYFGIGTTLSEHEESDLGGWRRRWRRRRRGRLYREADGIIATSGWVADDIAAISGLPRSRITVIGNPVVAPDFARHAAAPVDHPAFSSARIPVILGTGRLSHEKGFSVLLRAFALLRERIDARLVIIGEGHLRGELTALSRELGVGDDVYLPGFIDNPLAYMARAAVFVLPSHREGFGNVLVEALSVGTPVVATRCPGGPPEILREGELGILVPVADPPALADAILETLKNPLPAEQLKSAASAYTIEASTARYLRAFGITPHGPAS